MEQTTIFISSSGQDEEEKNDLVTHLRVLERDNQIRIWNEDIIGPGEIREERINDAMRQADIAILLITANFLSSDPLREQAFKLLDLQTEKKLKVLPVIARACSWDEVGWLNQIRMNVLPNHKKAVWRDSGKYVDEDLTEIVAKVKSIINEKIEAQKRAVEEAKAKKLREAEAQKRDAEEAEKQRKAEEAKTREAERRKIAHKEAETYRRAIERAQIIQLAEKRKTVATIITLGIIGGAIFGAIFGAFGWMNIGEIILLLMILGSVIGGFLGSRFSLDSTLPYGGLLSGGVFSLALGVFLIYYRFNFYERVYEKGLFIFGVIIVVIVGTLGIGFTSGFIGEIFGDASGCTVSFAIILGAIGAFCGTYLGTTFEEFNMLAGDTIGLHFTRTIASAILGAIIIPAITMQIIWWREIV